MRFILALFLIAALSFIAGLYGPWWTIAIVAFLVMLLLPMAAGRSFLAGFLAIFLLWSVIALVIDVKNEGYLAGQVGEMFGLGSTSLLMVLVTGIIGGLVSGLGAMTAAFLRPAKRRY